MLEILQGLIKQSGQQAVVENQDVPNEHNEGVMQEVMAGLMGGLQKETQGNNLGGLLSILTGAAGQQGGGLASNPIVGSIISSVAGNLMSKFGLPQGAAQGVVGAMIPQVLGGLINKSNDPNDSSVDLGGMMSVLSGGKTQGVDFGSLLGQAGAVMADGKLDMSDLLRVAGGMAGGQQQQQSAGGGLFGSILGGLFGKK